VTRYKWRGTPRKRVVKDSRYFWYLGACIHLGLVYFGGTMSKWFVAVTVFASLSFASGTALAACNSKRILRMAEQGETVAKIAAACDMTAKEVRAILDDDMDDDQNRPSYPDQKQNNKLPAGAPVGACGCWGPVNPAYRQPNPLCQSGIARPEACPAWCYGGGYAWRGVCG